MKTNKMVLDIAVLAGGKSDLFERCVEAILPHMVDSYQIHVCNNGHPSAEYERIYKKLPKNTIIRRLNEDMGFPIGANSSMKSGNSPLILFVTDDVFLHPDTVSKLVATMKDPTIAMCGLKLTFPKDSVDPNRPAGKVQHIGLSSSIRGEIVHPLIGWSAENPKCNISRDVLAVTGACFIVRRDYYQRAGGFSTAYGIGYYEDVDLAFTIRSLGGRIYINTDATATHAVGQTMKDKKLPPIQNNQALFMSRWGNQMAWLEWDSW